ncbi:MAG: hypothetical protein ABIP07_07110 [Sphingomicrobium sp.]
MIALLSTAAPAQVILTSPGPDQVAVTVYRDPNREGGAFDLGWLGGFALVSERRRVSIAAGESDLRFEGVAGGILPQSAIVSGLDNRIVERNRDARLLSPGTLLDASLGERLHLRRTSRVTGAVREDEAIVRATSNGIVIQTAAGIEALRCTGLAETLIANAVPAGLSAKPTLSVRVRSDRAIEADVVLSYLSYNFDWQANYVGTMSVDGSRLDLFGWLTLANGDATGFVQAATQAVAGRVNQQRVWVPRGDARPIRLSCWPSLTTSDIPLAELAMSKQEGFDIVVTGSRIMANAPPPPPPPAPERGGMMATQEELGDVKLYRIPETVTIAAHSQKQVALLHQPSVKVASVYRLRIAGAGALDTAAEQVLVTRNRPAEGLGLPLPSGRIVLFAPRGERTILIGEGDVADRAVGEEVEIRVGEAPGVRAVQRQLSRGKERIDVELMVSNDLPRPVRFEAELGGDGARLSSRTRLGRRNGRPLWAVTIPANGSATLRYRVPG